VVGLLLLAHCIRRQHSAQLLVVELFDPCGLAPSFVISVLLFAVVVFAVAARVALPDITTKVCRLPLGSLAGLVKRAGKDFVSVARCCVMNQQSLQVAGAAADASADGSDGVAVVFEGPRAAPSKKPGDARDKGIHADIWRPVQTVCVMVCCRAGRSIGVASSAA